MALPIELAAKVSGTGTQFRVPMPAKDAGDYIQFVFLADKKPSYGFTDAELVLEVPGALYVYQRYVNTTGGATGTSDGYLTRFASSTQYTAFAQVAHVAGAGNPPEPGGNEAARQALLGIATGAFSGLPFNSGTNPSGRGGRKGSPDGYQYLSDVTEQQRGVPFDVQAGFQYQTSSGGWNDPRGMQVLDWMDPEYPAILGLRPFPDGGSWTAAKNGDYDAHYVAIGQKIAEKRPAGTGRVVLRLAWELNGGWYAHTAVGKPDFNAGWRRAVEKIRQGAGDRVRFAWCLAGATSIGTSLSSYYPGDDWVDVVSFDVYDAFLPSGKRGMHSQADLLTYSGLDQVYAFAKAHGKIIGFDEWGGHATGGYNDGMDNPDFQTAFLGWVADHADDVAYEVQFNEVAAGNVENNLWLTNGNQVQLPNARARHIQIVNGL